MGDEQRDAAIKRATQFMRVARAIEGRPPANRAERRAMERAARRHTSGH